MDDEIFSQDIIKKEDDNHQASYTIFSKISLTSMRILACSIILIVLALFKYFSYTNYQRFGIWYKDQFKIESLNTAQMKDFTLNKFKFLQEKMKNKIDNL